MGMGQVNLYKIDGNKKEDFLNKLSENFEFIGEQDYNSLDNNEKVYVMSIGEKTLVFSADEKCAELFNKMVKLNR